MKTEVENALKRLIKLTDPSNGRYSATDLLHFSQAALNLAQTFEVFSEASKSTNLK